MATTFADRVERAAAHYFDEILPRYLDAYYRGRGYELIARMLASHDGGTVDQISTLPEPSARARRMAQGARRQCPIVAVPRSFDPARFGGAALLGLFQRNTEFVRELLVAYREVSTTFAVYVFEAGFAAAAIPEDAIDREIELTVFHEFIHYFESFLPAREQPLRAREQELEPPAPYSVEEAIRRDRRFAWRRAALRTGGLLVLAAILFAVTGSSLPRCDREQDLDALAAYERQLRADRNELRQMLDERDELASVHRALLAEMRTRGATDLAYAPSRLTSWLSQRGPPLDVTDRGDTLTVRGSEGAAELLSSLADVAPTLRVSMLTVYLDGWSVDLALPASLGEPNPHERDRLARPERAMHAPAFESDRGEQLRRSITELEAELPRLAEQLGELRYARWRTQTLAAEGRPDAGGDRVVHAAPLVVAVLLYAPATIVTFQFERERAVAAFSGTQTAVPDGSWAPGWWLDSGERSGTGADASTILLTFRWRGAPTPTQ